MMSPLPNVRQAYSLVIQEETQRGMATEQVEVFSISAACQLVLLRRLVADFN